MGAEQVAIDEAAANRRANFTSQAPDLFSQISGAPGVLSRLFGDIEANFRFQDENTDPGARLLEFLFAAANTNKGFTSTPEEPSLLEQGLQSQLI